MPYIVFPVDFGVLVVLESHATMLTTPTVLLLMSPTRLVLSGAIALSREETVLASAFLLKLLLSIDEPQMPNLLAFFAVKFMSGQSNTKFGSVK